MGIHEEITKSRKLVKAGAVLGYAGAIALAIIRFANTDPVTAGEMAGSLALLVALATPATLALMSLDRRPTLLPAAALTALATLAGGAVMLPVALATAFMWYQAWILRPVPAVTTRARSAARFGLAFLLLAAMLTLFVHVDPVCVQRLRDGSERTVDPAPRGFETGWALGLGVTHSAASTIGPDVAEETCSSDTIVLGEALASTAVTALVLAAASRWPQGTHEGAETPLRDKRDPEQLPVGSG